MSDPVPGDPRGHESNSHVLRRRGNANGTVLDPVPERSLAGADNMTCARENLEQDQAARLRHKDTCVVIRGFQAGILVTNLCCGPPVVVGEDDPLCGNACYRSGEHQEAKEQGELPAWNITSKHGFGKRC